MDTSKAVTTNYLYAFVVILINNFDVNNYEDERIELNI